MRDETPIRQRMPYMLALLAIIAAGTGGVTHCPARAIGPGSLQRGGTAGATCMLAAYRDHCRAADYTLSSFGVDTVHSERFQTAHRNGACVVLATESFRVIPQPPHVVAQRTCTRLRKLSTDIVADLCGGPKPHALSLTKRS